jgi:methionine-S-sulfoxide reductase
MNSNNNTKITETATLAGGCFWGVEELFRSELGVLKTQVGYTGGLTENPKYEQVKTGTTGHAEAIQIVFDPNIITFEKLLLLFFKLHDPTTSNRQGNDIGSQYRSAIFFHSESQENKSKEIIERINKTDAWKGPIVTEVVKFTKFYDAEEYHQDYLQKNPGGYTCHFVRKLDF